MSFLTQASEFSDVERRLMLDQYQMLRATAGYMHPNIISFEAAWGYWCAGPTYHVEWRKEDVCKAAREIMNTRLRIHSTPEYPQLRAPESLQAAVLRVKREGRT